MAQDTALQVIELQQLPIIVERLHSVKADIERRTAEATSLICTEETYKSVKDARAQLTKEFKEYEAQRTAIKSKILEPYNAFEQVYRECVTAPFQQADAELKQKIADVTSGIVAQKTEALMDYYGELVEAADIDWLDNLTYRPKVNMSDSLTSLKKQATLRENALTTLYALKTSLGIDPAEEDAQRDATLVQLINAASAWLETQLGRKLGKSTYRQRYCGTGTQQLSLEQYPIVSVERITDTFTGETITDFDFNETGEIGVLFREDGWTYRGHIGGLAYDYIAPRKYLEVQYVAGYILPKDATEDHPATLPADLEAIVWYMIAQQWAIIENDAAGLSAFSISDVSWTFDKNISETWQSVISKYQRW